MRMKNYKIVSLFSGCGGSDLGVFGDFSFLNKDYAKLPTKIIYANDNDAPAVATYKLNFGNEIILDDICNIPASSIPKHDILVAGFPCQPFSIVGMRKGLYDKRGLLFYEIIKVLITHKPSVFIAENVKGLTHVDKGKTLKMILEEFKNAGYTISHKVLHAADYGVPQKRERLFIVGFRNDLNKKFNFPEGDYSENGVNDKKKWVPLKSVIDSLIPDDPKYYFSERAVEGLKKSNKAFNKGRSQDLNKPCNTISSHLAKVSLNGTDPVLLVDKEKELYRRFTPREAARIQSFPENFEFAGGDLQAYKQIGNAVPPVLMWHIVKKVIQTLNNE
jgi:DNA (cytosine-5)-methyltransferase 1